MSVEILPTEVQRVIDHVFDPSIRETGNLEVGQVIHQGDVYLHVVPNDWPRGKQRGSRQVAIGTSVGSRHVVEGDVTVWEGVKLPGWVKPPEFVNAEELLGPVVVCDGPLYLTHPEHPHHKSDGKTFQVTYQADFTTQRRVAD